MRKERNVNPFAGDLCDEGVDGRGGVTLKRSANQNPPAANLTAERARLTYFSKEMRRMYK